MLLAISSCSKVEEGTADDARDVFVYSSQTIDLFEDDASLQVYNVIPYEDCYYAIVQSASELGVGAIAEVYLYCINSDGVIQSKIELDNNLNVYGDSEIVNDELLYVTYFGNIEKVNIHTGEKVYSEETHNDIVGISSCDDGYVVWGVGRIDKYDKDNKLVASIENDQWGFYSGYNTFYQDGDDCYLLSYGGWSYSYYKLNFEKGTSQLVYTPGKTEDCSGKYVFNTDGEFLLDIENSCMYPLAIWNEMDLQPPQYTQAEPMYIGIDDESFIQVYNYEGGFAQIVLYSYEGTENFSDRTYITVGGFGCNNDLSLMLAIYKFNTSQDEYRVVVEDYFDSNIGGGIHEIIEFNDFLYVSIVTGIDRTMFGGIENRTPFALVKAKIDVDNLEEAEDNVEWTAVVGNTEKDGAKYLEWAEKGLITICPGEENDITLVAEWFYSLYDKHDIRVYKCGYDQRFSKAFTQKMDEFGFDYEMIVQNKNVMCPPMRLTESKLKNKKRMRS